MEKNKNSIENMYFIEKMKPIDISKKLNISKSAVTQVLQKNDKYIPEKERRKKNNREKHNKDKIIFKEKKRKVNQHKENNDDLVLKKMHDQASRELSGVKTLSNMAYRNFNKSAYKYNIQKKRFEFREELGRSYAVPKYINVKI